MRATAQERCQGVLIVSLARRGFGFIASCDRVTTVASRNLISSCFCHGSCAAPTTSARRDASNFGTVGVATLVLQRSAGPGPVPISNRRRPTRCILDISRLLQPSGTQYRNGMPTGIRVGGEAGLHGGVLKRPHLGSLRLQRHRPHPHLRRARNSDEGGRSLFLVAQLTARWVTRRSREAKAIRADQAPPDESARRSQPALGSASAGGSARRGFSARGRGDGAPLPRSPNWPATQGR